MDLPDRLLLYDGVCGLCDRTVQFFLARDRDQRLFYAPLQGETAAALRAAHPEIPDALETLVFLEGGEIHLWSDAVLRALRHLPRWRLLGALLWIPRFVRDPVYRGIARHRYRIWGRYDACPIPSPDQQARFLA